MAALNDDVKVYIVTALACFDTPKTVIEDVKEIFGLTLTSQQVDAYNPKSRNGERLSKKFKDLFAQTRAEFLEDAKRVPIANASVRLRKLQRLVDKAESRGNAKMVAELLEQAAKETGGAFTNRRELGGAVGGVPIPAPQAGSTTAEEAYKAMLGGTKR
jgi:hypothetical protein